MKPDSFGEFPCEWRKTIGTDFISCKLITIMSDWGSFPPEIDTKYISDPAKVTSCVNIHSFVNSLWNSTTPMGK